MELTFGWKESNDCFYYYKKLDGLIVGQVHKIAHSEIYIAKVINVNEENGIGRYIDMFAAKSALETFWLIQSRTLLEDK